MGEHWRDASGTQSVRVLDLQGYVGKKVEVWGETIGAKQAGWLMDVGKIRIIE